MGKQHTEGFMKVVNSVQSGVQEITVEQLKELAQIGGDFALIDVREDHEWAAGHLEGAHHIGKGVLACNIEKAIPNKEKPLVLYCRGGYRSLIAADVAQRMGYKNVVSLAGGMTAWVKAGYPIEGRLLTE